jgi:mRNA-degrading endonuclease toxin of MazEF toxin-antitoxin module
MGKSIVSTPAKYPKQGEIYWSKSSRDAGDTKERPVVVISRDALNKDGDRITVVPLTTDLTAYKVSPLCRVILPAAITGLSQDGAAMCDKPRTILKSRLKGGPIGRINNEYLKAIWKGMDVARQNAPTIIFGMSGA